MFPIKSSRSLCILLLLCFLFTSCGRASQEPVPEDSSQVMESSDTSENMQVVNPVMEVSSLDEMQSQLGFEVPVLDKEIVSYVVLNIDEEPAIGCIDYKDGTAFRIQKGSGDISGIHGGVLESSVDFGSVTVFYYTMEDLHYALWECDGFTYSLEGAESLEADVTSFLVVSEPEITEPESSPTLEIALAEVSESPDSYHEYIADESPYQVDTQITPSAPISDFKVVALEFAEADDANVYFYVIEDLLTLESLTPEIPLRIRLELPETLPRIGVSYLDSDGEPLLYAITMSGLDGSPVLTEIQIAQVPQE